MGRDYYDLDEIIADGQKVPCKFNISVPGLGYLEGNPAKAVKKDTKLDLPLWLAEILAVCELLEETEEGFVDLLQPEFFGMKVLNALKSSPLSVNVHGIHPHFYKLAERWTEMFSDRELAELAMYVLKERAFEINKFSCNTNKQVNNEFLSTLDEFEKEIYKASGESNRQIRTWLKS